MASSAAPWQPLYLESDIPGYPVRVSGPAQSRYNANGHMFSSPFWTGTYAVGRVLSWPTTTLVYLFCRAFLCPFAPGRFDQMNSPALEFLRRVVTGIIPFLMIPIALVLIPFGILLRVLAVALGKKDLTFISPPESVMPTEAAQLPSRVVLRTQNLGFIPHVSPVNGLAVPPKRAPAMLRDIKSGQDDIICLQELFDLTVIDRVIREIGAGRPEIRRPTASEQTTNGTNIESGRRLTEEGATYPWAICDVDPKPYRLNSGLFIGSRYPVIDPEFIRFSVASRDDILAGKGVLGCTVVLGEIGGRKCKLSLFTTHTQAGHYLRIHTYQFRAIMEFMAYYNKKYLRDDDIIVASLMMGDYNMGPLFSQPDPHTGKMRLSDEWPVMKSIFDEYGMRNFYYDKTSEGLARVRNREIIMQLQELWYAEGVRAWQRLHVKGVTRETQDLERADGTASPHPDAPWKMDPFAFLDLLRTLVTRRETDPADSLQDATVEAELKQELARQVTLDSKKKIAKQDHELRDLGDLNVAPMLELVNQLTGLPDGQGGRVEKLIPGSAIEMKGYRTLFPTEVKLCDIDHVLMPKRINGRKPLVRRAHIRIVNEGVFEYTDHYGKRTTLDIPWDRLTAAGDGGTQPVMAAAATSSGIVVRDELVDVEGPGKERIRDDDDDVGVPYTHGAEVVIPVE